MFVTVFLKCVWKVKEEFLKALTLTHICEIYLEKWNLFCKAEIEMQDIKIGLWTQWGKERVG